MMCTFLSFSVVLSFPTPGFIVDTFTVYSLRRKNFSQNNKKKKQNDSSPYGSYVTELQYWTGKKAERKIVKHECSDQNTIIIIRTLLL